MRSPDGSNALPAPQQHWHAYLEGNFPGRGLPAAMAVELQEPVLDRVVARWMHERVTADPAGMVPAEQLQAHVSRLLVLLIDLPSWGAVSLTAAVLAALVRSARPADLSSTGALDMTEAGPVPVGLVARLVRGPDTALLAVAPMRLQLGPVVALLLPLLLLAAVMRRETRTQ